MTGRCVKCNSETILGSNICDDCAKEYNKCIGILIRLVMFGPVILGVLLLIIWVLNK
jgi:hypothetical protein